MMFPDDVLHGLPQSLVGVRMELNLSNMILWDIKDVFAVIFTIQQLADTCIQQYIHVAHDIMYVKCALVIALNLYSDG